MWNEDYLDQLELTPATPGWHDEPVGFLESAKRSFSYLSKTRLTNSGRPMQAEIMDRNIRLQGLIESGEIDARPYYRQPDKVDAFSIGLDHYDYDGLAAFAKSLGHEVDTDEEIRNRYRADALQAQQDFEESDSVLGTIAGGFAAELTDPVMLASSLVGIGAARNLATATRLALLATENAAVVGVTIPDKQAYAQQIDQQYGAKEAALDVLAAAAMPVALDTAARTVGKVLKMIPNRTKQSDDLADSLLEAPPERTIEEHFAAQEQAIVTVENPKRAVNEDDLPKFDDNEIDRQFNMIDAPEARAEIDEIQKAVNDMDIIEACLTGKL